MDGRRVAVEGVSERRCALQDVASQPRHGPGRGRQVPVRVARRRGIPVSEVPHDACSPR